MEGQHQYFYLVVEEERYYLKEKLVWEVVLMLKVVDLVLNKELMERGKELYHYLLMKVLILVIVRFLVT